MCTIFVFHQVYEDAPVVIAANRDEFLHRPSTGPIILAETPWIVGGKDLEKGGTWLGITASGFFVCVTNVRGTLTMASETTDHLSRGALVMDLLQTDNTQQALDRLRACDARQYRAFNLLFGDMQQLWTAYGRQDQEKIELNPVPPGFHVLPNARLNSPTTTKVARAQQLYAQFPNEPWPACIPSLQSLLRNQDKPPLDALPHSGIEESIPPSILQELEAICVQMPTYGTCSATLFGLTPQGPQHYLFADGSPTKAPFKPFTHLLTPHTTQ